MTPLLFDLVLILPAREEHTGDEIQSLYHQKITELRLHATERMGLYTDVTRTGATEYRFLHTTLSTKNVFEAERRRFNTQNVGHGWTIEYAEDDGE
jgi:hypothetical protein